MAINKMLLSCPGEVFDARVDVQVDKQGVIHAWNNQGGRSSQLNNAMKVLFSTTAALNVLLHPHCFSISGLGRSSPNLFAKYEASMHSCCPK